MKKVLIGSPIRQKKEILKEFLLSLSELYKDNIEVYYYFIDDNNDKESSKLLDRFKNQNDNVIIKPSSDYNVESDNYICDEEKHGWKTNIIQKVIVYKNDIIEYARIKKFDYLFLIDSDLILNKNTLTHLVSRNVDVVSNVFWTQWVKNNRIEPQVWLQDTNSFYKKNWDREYNKEEIEQLSSDFINMLKIPGIYKVGGLGACTLLSKKAIESGVNFSLLDNVSFWGEDRHFCIRARALNLELYVDTVYPAFHIYREALLNRVNDFKKEGFNPDKIIVNDVKPKYIINTLIKKIVAKLSKVNMKSIKNKIKRLLKKYYSKRRLVQENNKVVLSMIVRNESNNYLETVLKDAIQYVDEVLIIDDASEDNTVEICEKVLYNIPHKIIVNEYSMFSTEYKLRKKQWEETIKLNPGWIIFLDADEIFEDKMKRDIKYLISNKEIDLYNFRLFDMWNKEEYREDKYWNIHTHYMPFLMRYQPKFHYLFKKTNQHCGRLPKNTYIMNQCNSEIRCKHLGWSRIEDRKRKYERYMKLDATGKDGSIEQYNSILDENPHLVRFEDEN